MNFLSMIWEFGIILCVLAILYYLFLYVVGTSMSIYNWIVDVVKSVYEKVIHPDYKKIYSSIRLDDNNIMNSILKGPCPTDNSELKIFLERVEDIKRKRGIK